MQGIDQWQYNEILFLGVKFLSSDNMTTGFLLPSVGLCLVPVKNWIDEAGCRGVRWSSFYALYSLSLTNQELTAGILVASGVNSKCHLIST